MAELVVEGQVCLLNQLYMNTCPNNNNTDYIVNDNNNMFSIIHFFIHFFIWL